MQNYIFVCNIPCNLELVWYNRGMKPIEENCQNSNEPWYDIYVMSRSFIENIVSKFGKKDLFFRDCYNYRNLSKNDLINTIDSSCTIQKICRDFPKHVVDKYVSAIGRNKFKKCLDAKDLVVETLFDDQDYFVDCKDVQDFWKDDDSVFPEIDGSQYVDFERYLMEDIEDFDLKRNESFYILREKTKSLEDC